MATLNELFETYVNANFDGTMSEAAIVKAYELLLGLTGDFADKSERVQFWVDKNLAVSEFVDEFLATAARLSAEKAAAWGETVTARTAVVTAAQNAAATATTLEEIGSAVATAYADTQPQTFTLTTGTDSGDSFKGGAGDDTFTAAVLTANDGDSLDGGAGTDTLNLETAASITDKFVTTGIETVNLNALGALTVDTKSMTGVTTLNSNDAAGAVTVNNIASADLVVGVKGSATNSVDLNYASSALSGSADKLSVSLNGSTATTITADTGFESVDVKTTAASTLATLTASGATALTLSGDAALTVNDNTIDSFTDYTISNTAKVTLGSVGTVKNVDASANTGGVVAQTLSTDAASFLNGHATDELTMHTAGGLVQTGSGDDNIALNSGSVFSTASTIVKLGAGNDKLSIEAVSASGEYVYGEDGDDTIYVGAALTSSDLIDGGAGTDTVNFSAASHSLIAKGVEKVGVNGATTVAFVSTDTATQIADGGAAAVTFSNLLNGSTYTSSVAKTGLTTLGFKSAEAATINADFTKGTTGGLTTTNAADVTATYGAASAVAAAWTLDAAATKLTIAATGALTGASAIAASGTEKLQTISVTGDKAVTLGAVTNLDALTSFSMSSTGGKVTVGNLDNSGYTTADQTVSEITATSSTNGAVIGNIDFTGVTSTVTGEITAITATGVGTAANDDATIGTIAADKLGTVTATSTKQDATIGNVTVGLDTATTYTDGTITALKASGFLEAQIGNVLADNIGSIVVESTDTTTGGAVSLGNVDAADGTANKATIGTIDVSSKKLGATVGTLEGATLGNVTVTGGTTAGLGAVTVANSDGNSTTGDITVTAGSGTATLADIDVETVGTITAKSTSGGVVFNDMTFDDASGVAVVLNGGTGSVAGASAETINNTKGDLSVTVTAGTTFAAGAKQTITAGATTVSDIDVVVDASAVTGNVGATGGATDLTVVNEATDASSSVIVKGGAASNWVTLDADGGTVTYYGQSGADTVTLKDGATYTSSTIYAESGADHIYLASGTDTVDLGSDADADKIFIQDASTDSTSSKMDVITNFVIANDTIDLASAVNGGTASGSVTFVVASNVTASAGTTNGIATGMFTFDKAAATSLSDAITKVGADVSTAGDAVIFEYNSDTYFFADTDGTTATTSDLIIKLTGVDSTSMAAATEVFTIS